MTQSNDRTTTAGTEFSRTGDGSYRVVGSLVFATVRDVLRQSGSAFAAESQLVIDLSQVAAADSAGLALLIEWYRLAERAKQPLKFSRAPPQLVALAKISDIDTLLPFG